MPRAPAHARLCVIGVSLRSRSGLPDELDAQIDAFVEHYNHQRYHESINNVTSADVYFGRDKAILQQRERIKQKTFDARRLHRRQQAA